MYTDVDKYLAEQFSLPVRHETFPICNLSPNVSKYGHTPTMKCMAINMWLIYARIVEIGVLFCTCFIRHVENTSI